MTMRNLIPQEIVRQAEDLSKETRIPFRTLLETLYEAYLEARPKVQPNTTVQLLQPEDAQRADARELLVTGALAGPCLPVRY